MAYCADFESGRASRPEYWGFVGSHIIILIVAGILDVVFETEAVLGYEK